MEESQHSSSSRETSLSPSPDEEESLLLLQIRAFLEASDEVETEPEVVEDLLQVLAEHEKQEEHQDLDSADTLQVVAKEIAMSGEAKPDPEPEVEDDEHEWNKQEVNEMLKHLKERGASSFIREYVQVRNIPIPRLLSALGVFLCHELRNLRPKTLLYFLKVAMSHQMRERLGQYNTVDDAVRLIQSSQRIMILTGAGISVSCGIPDFRSRDGLYVSLKAREDFDLDDPQQMFDIQYFKENPSVFYKIYPSNFIPSPCHRFIKCMEDKGKLLRNYTQNIDTLETVAGVKRVLQCHGSFATATCLQCRRQVPGSEIEREIMAQKVPLCAICNPPNNHPHARKQTRKQAKGVWDSDAEDESDAPDYPPGIMKPDITFFGEKLDDQFDRALADDRDNVDLLIVIGTSLKVSPVAEILYHLPHSIPQILINKTPIRHINPDIIFLGNADDVVSHLSAELGWELPSMNSTAQSDRDSNQCKPPHENSKKRPYQNYRDIPSPRRVGNSHVWLFNGAEGGKWLEELQKTHEQDDSLGYSEHGLQTSPVEETPLSSVSHDHPDRQLKKQKFT